jgi:hypothetical protein
VSFFYRFRTTDALLGERQELEKQEIYFASPEQLNDPMEGFKELFWHGDQIVWRNLIRHYLLCLMQTVAVAMIAGKEYQPIFARGFIFSSQLTLPTETLKALYQRVCAIFFAVHSLDALPALLASREHPVRRDELEFYLRGLHPTALQSVIAIFREEKLIPPANTTKPLAPEFTEETIAKNLTRVLNAIKDSKNQTDAKTLRAAFSAARHIHSQMDLITYLGTTNELAKAWHSIFFSFPERYVDSLGDLVYFDWYAACFIFNPAHAAMWGNYGNGHKGVCLKFRAEEKVGQPPMLKMRGVVGTYAGPTGQGPTYGDISLPFQKMNYVDKLAEIDFFRSIGRVTVVALKSEWYSDSEGRISICADHVFAKTNDWHQRYWAAFREMTATKLRDWQHEDEYRLMLTSGLGTFQEAKDRKLVYGFTNLEGIIFGIRTPLEDKVRIVNIIDRKCAEQGRRSFEFSQAIYNAQSGKIEPRKLDLLQFKTS